MLKNIVTYRLTKPFKGSRDRLEELFAEHPARDCSFQESSVMGFVPPFNEDGPLVEDVFGVHLFAVSVTERVLPAAAITREVKKRARAMAEKEGRAVGRAERAQIKEQVLIEMLPTAPQKDRVLFAWIDPSLHSVFVDAGSARQAEDVCSFVRRVMGSFPIRPLYPALSPVHVFTGWVEGLSDEEALGHELLPQGLSVGRDCNLEDSDGEGTASIRSQDLSSGTIQHMIQSGYQVTQLRMRHEKWGSFNVTADLHLKQIKFPPELTEQLETEEYEDAGDYKRAVFWLQRHAVMSLHQLLDGSLATEFGQEWSDEAPQEPVPADPLRDGPPIDVAPPSPEEDALYAEVVSFVRTERRASISSVQRKFKIGYNRAAHLVDDMEARGVISPADHNGQREVLVPPERTH